MLLTIEGKWLETIVHMMKSKFLDLLCPKQVQFFISIRIHGKFWLLPTFALTRGQSEGCLAHPKTSSPSRCGV
jgi:hypothetical protein